MGRKNKDFKLTLLELAFALIYASIKFVNKNLLFVPNNNFSHTTKLEKYNNFLLIKKTTSRKTIIAITY